jgi:hypothetical protein
MKKQADAKLQVTYDEREAVRARAAAAGKSPTTAGINATVAKNRAVTDAKSKATYAEREGVRARAVAAGKSPTTKGINATVAKNRARTAAAAAAAPAASEKAPEKVVTAESTHNLMSSGMRRPGSDSRRVRGDGAKRSDSRGDRGTVTNPSESARSPRRRRLLTPDRRAPKGR